MLHVIDMYNTLLQAEFRRWREAAGKDLKSRVGYISKHITGPMFDSASDWMHPDEEVTLAEVEYILKYVFDFSFSHHQSSA